jgi:hypothetical protein
MPLLLLVVVLAHHLMLQLREYLAHLDTQNGLLPVTSTAAS